MNGYLYGGLADVGWKRELNEDAINVKEFGDDVLFAVIADGAGSKNGRMLQPAKIAIDEVTKVIGRIHDADPKALRDNAELIVQEAIMTANRVLSAFRIANEELYAGFGTTITIVLIFDDNEMVFGHVGNNQLMLVRESKTKDVHIPRILTKEMTKAKEELDQGIIRPDMFDTHPDRMVITSVLGWYTEPEIQVFSMTLKPRDFVILTTDGIHYAIRPEPLAQIVLDSGNCDDAVANLVEAAKKQNYSDNMSAIVLFNNRNE